MRIGSIISKIRIKKWKKDGAIIGDNLHMERNSYLDSSFPWLITIGNNVTIAPDVLILSHDGSTQKAIGYSKIGKVTIGDNSFIGCKSIILPDTVIGDNCVIGAGSIVKGVFPENTIISGAPARVMQSLGTFKEKNERRLESGNVFDVSYTKKGKITKEKKQQMLDVMESSKNSFVV